MQTCPNLLIAPLYPLSGLFHLVQRMDRESSLSETCNKELPALGSRSVSELHKSRTWETKRNRNYLMTQRCWNRFAVYLELKSQLLSGDALRGPAFQFPLRVLYHSLSQALGLIRALCLYSQIDNWSALCSFLLSCPHFYIFSWLIITQIAIWVVQLQIGPTMTNWSYIGHFNYLNRNIIILCCLNHCKLFSVTWNKEP